MFDTQVLALELQDVVGSTCRGRLNRIAHHPSKTVREENIAAVLGLRDSIVYRFEAMLYHVNVMNEVTESYRAYLDETRPTQEESRSLLRRAATQQLFLFDDIVFATSSLFDYLGSYVATILQGPQLQKVKWKGANKLASDREFEKRETGRQVISKSAAGVRIGIANREWVNKLNEYRADLIHRRAAKPDGQLTRDFLAKENAHTITAFAPTGFLRRMPVSFGVETQVPINVTMEWLILKTFTTVVDISLSLLSDVYDMPHPLAGQPIGPMWLPSYM